MQNYIKLLYAFLVSQVVRWFSLYKEAFIICYMQQTNLMYLKDRQIV